HWFAVGCEAHDLVFLTKAIKADELAKRRVEQPQRMWNEDPVKDRDSIPFTPGVHCRGKISGRVVGEPGSLIEVARVIGTRQMGEMMFHARNLETAISLGDTAAFRDELLNAPHLFAPLEMCDDASRRLERRMQHTGNLRMQVRV